MNEKLDYGIKFAASRLVRVNGLDKIQGMIVEWAKRNDAYLDTETKRADNMNKFMQNMMILYRMYTGDISIDDKDILIHPKGT